MALVATLLLLALPAAAIATPARHVLTEISLIPVRLGENLVAHFATDGRPARIIVAWRGNGNAHSYDLFLVTMPGGEMHSDWNVVGTDIPNAKGRAFADVVTDAPHTG